jgi:hypothetical protein
VARGKQRGALAVLLVVGMLTAGAGEAAGSNIVFVCGKDLCAAEADGSPRVRLTSDGKARGGYTRPALSRAGRRLAFKLGDPGRVWTSRVIRRRGRIVGLGKRTRIPPFRDGPRDATQFDVAIAPDGSRVAWVEIRANVVFGGFDFRRYSARTDGSGARQEASNGGRPFVAWYDNRSIIREGLAPGFDGAAVDQGLCIPAPRSATNGTCIAGARQLAFDPGGRHLRHPSVAPGGRLLVATAYAHADPDIDTAIERAGAIALFDARSAAPLRDLTAGPADRYPSFAPNGRAVAFERRGAVWIVGTGGDRPRRVLRAARQPTWSQ